MKLTDEGEYVFLELNPMGQYLYIEILAGLPLTAAMAELLAFGRHDRTPAAAPGTRVIAADPWHAQRAERETVADTRGLR